MLSCFFNYKFVLKFNFTLSYKMFLCFEVSRKGVLSSQNVALKEKE